MSSSNCGAIQRHIERQARGRQQRFDKQRDQDEGRIVFFRAQHSDCFDQVLKTYKKNVAGRILEDFHSSGVDEDLEVLKAGWASHFKERPGRPRPQRPLLADLRHCTEELEELEELDDFESGPRSLLAAQGERAKQRLQGLEKLRHLAGKGTGMAESEIALSNQFGGIGAFPDRFSFHPIPKPRAHGPLQHAGKLVRGPKPTRKESKSNERGKKERSLSDSKVDRLRGDRDTRDLWAEWEARWSQEFRRLEEMEKNRQKNDSSDAGASWAEQEEQWYRRVHEKRREANAHHACHRAYSKASEDGNRSSSKTSKPRKAKSAKPQPEPTEPPPPPDQSVHAVQTHQAKKFNSFADFSAAWSAFEKRLSDRLSGTAFVRSAAFLVSDIPWPNGIESVSGTISSDTAAEAKKKLRTALLRWHPDKWAPILEHVAEADRAEVIARVKLVTQRLLEEKQR